MIISWFTSSTTGRIVYDEIKYAFQIYLFWTFIHNVSLYLYKRLCTPETFWSYIFSPLLAMTPQCKALFFMLDNSTNAMNKMMIGLSMWVLPKLTSLYNFNTKHHTRKEHNE